MLVNVSHYRPPLESHLEIKTKMSEGLKNTVGSPLFWGSLVLRYNPAQNVAVRRSINEAVSSVSTGSQMIPCYF